MLIQVDSYANMYPYMYQLTIRLDRSYHWAYTRFSFSHAIRYAYNIELEAQSHHVDSVNITDDGVDSVKVGIYLNQLALYKSIGLLQLYATLILHFLCTLVYCAWKLTLSEHSYQS